MKNNHLNATPYIPIGSAGQTNLISVYEWLLSKARILFVVLLTSFVNHKKMHNFDKNNLLFVGTTGKTWMMSEPPVRVM